jgi:hypothetical protein
MDEGIPKLPPGVQLKGKKYSESENPMEASGGSPPRNRYGKMHKCATAFGAVRNFGDGTQGSLARREPTAGLSYVIPLGYPESIEKFPADDTNTTKWLNMNSPGQRPREGDWRDFQPRRRLNPAALQRDRVQPLSGLIPFASMNPRLLSGAIHVQRPPGL